MLYLKKRAKGLYGSIVPLRTRFSGPIFVLEVSAGSSSPLCFGLGVPVPTFFLSLVLSARNPCGNVATCPIASFLFFFFFLLTLIQTPLHPSQGTRVSLALSMHFRLCAQLIPYQE